jgi:signal transduction histidine kinase
MLERARSSDQPLEWRGTADLAEDLRRGFAAVMAGHEAEAAAPEIDLEDAEVEVSKDHVDSIASLMVNGALQRPDTPIEVRGRVDTGGRYTLTIRDHGVAPADRGPALERVRAGLGLHTAGAAERSPSYRGMGIGLPLCSLQLSLHGARVWAREPSEGRGLELVVQLPSAADRNPSLEPTRTRP